MNTVKTEHRFSERVIAFLLAFFMMFTLIPDSFINVSAADDEFEIKLSWNHDPEHPTDTTYDSNSNEKKDIRLKISFSNKKVSKEYKPGELIITVTGMKDAVRSGNSYIPVGIAADKESVPADEKNYNWSYSYTEATDTYTFTNNFTVESQSVFEGSLEIIWELPSRDTKHNFTKDFTAELFVDGKTVTSESVKYTQTREKDTYTVEITPSTVYDDELYVPKDERGNYTWVKYNINSGDTYLARDVKDEERFEVWFLEDAIVNGGGLTATEDTKDIDGKKYKKYTFTKDIKPDTEQPVIEDVIVAYPKDKYPDTESVTVYTKLYGTYYEEEKEDELANAKCEVALKDYGFKDPPGDIYHVDKKSYGIHNMTIDQKYAYTGAIDARHLTNGGGEYYSDLRLSLNMKPHNNADITAEVIPVDYYDIEFVDDFLDIQMKDGSIRQLNDDEYHFTKIRIPPNTEIHNINGLPIKADTYKVEIWGRSKDSTKTGLDAFDVKLSSDDLKITGEEQFINIEGKNIVGVKIKISQFKETLMNIKGISSSGILIEDTPLVCCYYAFSLTGEEAEKVMTDGGRLFNNMFVNLDMKREDDPNLIRVSSGTADDYLGDDADRLKNRDSDIYGKLQDREKADTPIIEIPNEFKLKNTKIVATGSEGDSYKFEGSMTGEFTLGEDTLLEKFSMYTIVPNGLCLEEIYNDPEALLDKLDFSSSTGLSSAFIASHVKIKIKEDYNDSGRQYISFDFDFSKHPIDIGTITVSGIPMYIAKKDLTGGTHSYTMNGALLVDQEGKWNSETVDNNSMEGGIWKDIDGDKDTDEPASFRSSTASIVHSEQTLVSLVKYVSTPFTNGVVNPDAEKTEAKDAPKTLIGGEYSYWLKATVSSTTGGGAKNIVFADVIENKTKNKSEWQGEFVGIDYSQALSQLNFPEGTKTEPIVYYSTKEVEFDQITNTVDGKEVSHNDFDSSTFKDSSDWTTEKPADNKTIRAIAIDFGEGIASPEKVLWVEIKMKAPNTTEYCNKIAKNQCSVTYEKINGVGSDTEHQGLDSNVVPVTYVPKGKIVLNKLDEVDGTYIAGATFELYKKADVSDGEDTLINTYTVGKNGKLIVSDLEYGEYYFVETKAPKGYHLNEIETSNKTETVKLNQEEQSAAIEIENERDPGTFSIKKVSDRQPELGLEGAVFKLYKADGTLVGDTEYTTNADGTLKLENLEWGSYYLKETKAPDGYNLSDEKIEFTINAENDAGKELETVTVKNEQIPAKVKLTKYELKDPYAAMSVSPEVNEESPIKGAIYTLYDDKDNKITTKITDGNGEIYVEDLTFGKYYFMETTAATGYEKYSEKIPFEVTAEHTEAGVYQEVETADTRKTGSVHLQKTDDSGDAIHPANPVPGAVYRLYEKKDKDFKNPLKFTNNGEGKYTYSIGGGTTDLVTYGSAEGFFDVDGLQWGDYVLKEYKAPQGYELNEEGITIHIGQDNVGSGAQTFSEIDKRSLGNVKLKKVSEEDKTSLAGAVFTLYRDDGSVYKDDIKTGADGTVEVENIPWGSYYFLEKEAPSGYGLNDKKFKFVVNYLTAGKTQEITVEDPEKNYQFTVTKKIKKSDIIFEHGNPTFIFEVKKTDGSDEHTYRKMLSFSEDTDLTEDSEGYVTASVVFIVPAGEYEISEISVNRYKLEEITCSIMKNVTISDNKATFKVDDSNQNFTFTFKNKKTDQSGTSDNGMITNTLNKSRSMIGIAAEYVGPDIVTEDVIPKDSVQVYALYDNGTKELLSNDDFILGAVDTSKPNTVQEIKVTYDNDGKHFEDTVSVQIGNLNLFEYSILSDEAPDGYDGVIVITGYKGNSSVINFPATIVDTKDGTEKIYKVKKVGDGNTLKYKGDSIFDKDVRTVTFAEGIEEIGDNAFHPGGWEVATNENYLQCELVLPSTLNKIGNNAFRTSNITGLTLKENSLTEIGDSAFYSCTDLKGDLAIPSTVQKIGQSAFNGTCISSLTFSGNNLTEIGANAFRNPDDWGIAHPEFLNCELDLPSSLQKIGNDAFRGSHITKLTFNGNNLTEIGSSAFGWCKNLAGDLTIPDSVEKIGNRAFSYCEKLNGTLKLPNNGKLESIDMNTFFNCSFTGKLEIPASVKKIGYGAFGNDAPATHGKFTELILNEGLEEISVWTEGTTNYENHGSFHNCINITGELKIPSTVKIIGQGAFQDCTGFTGLEFTGDSSLVTIEKDAFKYCTGFTGDLIIPNSVTSIGQDSFNGCTGFDGKLKVSRNVETIGGYAFRNCNKFTELELVSSKLTTLGSFAFWVEDNNIKNGAIIIPNVYSSFNAKGPFFGCSKCPIIYVPVTMNDTNNLTFGIDSAVKTYTDYNDLRTNLGDKAAELGVDKW